MILTRSIVVRLCVIGIVTALAQVACFAKMDVFGSSPDVAVLVVMTLGLLGGSLTGAVAGFGIGLLIDCLLLETLGAFALTLLSVGYVAGRYRESIGLPRRAGTAVLGGALTLLAIVAFAAIQVGIGIDADVSTVVIRDAFFKTLIGAALAVPVMLLVRLLLRPALIDDRRAARRPVAPRAAQTGT